MKNVLNKITDFFYKRPVLVLVIELFIIACWAFCFSIPAIKGDAACIRLTGYIDTELWYALFGVIALFVCCIEGVFMSFEEFRTRKGDLEHERTTTEE